MQYCAADAYINIQNNCLAVIRANFMQAQPSVKRTAMQPSFGVSFAVIFPSWTDKAARVSHQLLSPSSYVAYLVPQRLQKRLVWFDTMRVSLFLPVSFTLLCSAQLKPCYEFWGHGRRLSSQIPCDPSANVSACCAPGGSCATNFYCNGAAVNDTFKRIGGCTDESGNDPACPLHLLQGKGPFPLFFVFVQY